MHFALDIDFSSVTNSSQLQQKTNFYNFLFTSEQYMRQQFEVYLLRIFKYACHTMLPKDKATQKNIT